MEHSNKNDPPFGKIIKLALITLAIGLTLVFIRSSFFPDVDHPPAETANPNETFEGTNPPNEAEGANDSTPLTPGQQ